MVMETIGAETDLMQSYRGQIHLGTSLDQTRDCDGGSILLAQTRMGYRNVKVRRTEVVSVLSPERVRHRADQFHSRAPGTKSCTNFIQGLLARKAAGG